MSDFKNRIGQDGFFWWVGVVEDRKDPLNLGRCKVRIFGSHTDDLSKIPTSSLPWCMPLNPVNGARSFSTPMEGDYVFGFFMDGASCQAPAMLGVFPGIPQNSPEYNKGFSSKAKYFNSDVSEKDDTKPTTQENAPAMAMQKVGQPTTPAAAFTKEGTSIQASDNDRVHVCDIGNKLRFDIATKKLEQSAIFQSIRDAIEAITAASAANPVYTAIVNAAKAIRAFAKMISRGIKFVSDTIKEITEYLKFVKTMIDYIQSLPSQIAQFLKDCLADLKNSVTKSSAYQSTSKLVSQINTVNTTISSATQLAQTTANAAEQSFQEFKFGMKNYSLA